MRLLLAALCALFAAAACTQQRDFVAVDPGSEAIIFTDDRTMANDIQIVVRRLPSGDYMAESFELYYERGWFGRWVQKARPLLSKPVSLTAYAKLVAQFDDDALGKLERNYPPKGADGWTWRLRHISDGRETGYAFWTPEWVRDRPAQDLRGLDDLLELGRQITQTAGMARHEAFERLKVEKNPAYEALAADLGLPYKEFMAVVYRACERHNRTATAVKKIDDDGIQIFMGDPSGDIAGPVVTLRKIAGRWQEDPAAESSWP